MQTEFFDDVRIRIFHNVEIAVVAVARHEVAGLAIPARVLHAHILSRNHLAVEEHILRAVLLIILFDKAQNAADKLLIFFVVGDLYAQTFCRFDHTVDANRQILALNVDISGIKQREHTLRLQGFQVLIVSQLHLMYEIYDRSQIFRVVQTFAGGLLHAAVQVDRQHTLRTG